jgi:hypothetical protein
LLAVTVDINNLLMVVEFARNVVAHHGMMFKWINCIELISNHVKCNSNGSKMVDAVDVLKLNEEFFLLY